MNTTTTTAKFPPGRPFLISVAPNVLALRLEASASGVYRMSYDGVDLIVRLATNVVTARWQVLEVTDGRHLDGLVEFRELADAAHWAGAFVAPDDRSPLIILADGPDDSGRFLPAPRQRPAYLPAIDAIEGRP